MLDIPDHPNDRLDSGLEASDFAVGDRLYAYHSDLIDEVREKFGTVLRVGSSNYIHVEFDGVPNPLPSGWSVNPQRVVKVLEVTDDEIAELFGLKTMKRDPQYVYTLMADSFVAVIAYNDDAPKIAETFFDDYFGRPMEWERQGPDWVGSYNASAYDRQQVYLNREVIEGA